MKRGRKSWKLPQAQHIHFDIDEYINHLALPSQVHRFPKPVARFLGYREKPAPEVGNVLVAIWSLVGTFCGILLVGAVFHYSARIKSYNPPIVFASFGAAAILDYNMIQSPLAQPRAAIFGHALAATTGVAVAKLFMLRSDFESIRWIAGAASCGIASSLMTLTKTVHPPGGAAALLAAVDPTVNALGWMFVPLTLLGSTLMLVVALLVNNIQRQYPSYWWSSRAVGRTADVENKREDKSSGAEHSMEGIQGGHFQPAVVIASDHVVLPEGFTLDLEEVDVLGIIRDRLRDVARQRNKDLSNTLSSDDIDGDGANEVK